MLTEPVWPSSVCSSLPIAASHSRTVWSYEADASCLLSGENATVLTKPVWPSSVYSSLPVAASHSRTVLSSEADTSCLPSGENATALTESVWPLSVCRAAIQFACMFVFVWIQGGTHLLNRPRTMLFSGAKMRAEQYIWRGACSITDRLYRANRFAS